MTELYLPGKSRFHLAFLGAFGLLVGSIKAVLLERQAIRETGTAIAMLSLLATGEPLRFEEAEPPAVQGLGLAGGE